MKTKQSLPPKWADRLLSWFCKGEVLENVQGDLHEIYQKHVDKFGKRRANQLFIWDVLSFLIRPRMVKKFEGSPHLNQYGIFKSHLNTSIRNIQRNVLFSGLNIAGLAISMSVGIMMIVFLSELHSIDAFHKNRDSIYRVTTTRQGLFEGEVEYLASASYYIADQIEAQIPEVEQVLVISTRELELDLKTEERGIAITGYYATASFFDVLSYKLKKGNPKTALENPGSIILTASAAKKLFGNLDPMGKTIDVDGEQDFQNGIITGIMEDPPINSYLHFEMLISMKTSSFVDDTFRNNPETLEVTGKYTSWEPFISNDGMKLYYVSKRPVNPGDSINKTMDIWVLNREGNDWSDPIHLGDKVNTDKHELHPSVAASGNLYYANRGIYFSEFKDGSFRKSVPWRDPGDTLNWNIDPFIAPDESYLIFASNRSGGFGQADMYISFRNEDGSWNPAKNMGETMNSRFNDYPSGLSPDGKYFFFASGKSFGRMDIYWVDSQVIEDLR